jgi:hypothetical protein
MRCLAALIGAIVLGAAGSASATIVDVSYTGTVLSGSDGSGIFGPAGVDLTGATFSTTYVFDDTLGHFLSPGELFGGPAFGFPTSPALSVSITIDGVTFTAAPSSSADIDLIDRRDSGDTYGISSFAGGATGNFSNNVLNPPISTTISGTTLTGVLDPSLCSLPDNQCGDFVSVGIHLQLANAGFSVNPLPPIFFVSSVPEPATWAVMLVGFGALGAAMRRSHTRVAVSR